VKQLLDAYYRFLQALITGLMFVLIIPVSMQIFSRYTGGLIPRYIWTEEISAVSRGSALSRTVAETAALRSLRSNSAVRENTR
jgi:hypothetical protein